MTRSLLIIILLFFSLNGYAEEVYEVRFGYVSQQENKKFKFLRETNLVPLIPMNAGVYYGVEIKSIGNNPFTASVSIFAPNNSKVKLPNYNFADYQVIPLGFDGNNDLEGKYKIEVQINSQIHEIFFDALSVDTINQKILAPTESLPTR